MSRSPSQDPALASGPTPRGLGTFAGVFTPSILTILGIILFLRLGFVVGNAGLGRALVVILIANAVSVLTSFSLAAIATNFRVRGGGDYYLISRTLGPEFGGAIGIVLFLAQSVSIAFYAIGFGEGLSAIVGVEWLQPKLVAALAIGPLFVLSWMGSDWATRFQYAIMVVLVAAITVFVVGGVRAWDPANLSGNWAPSGDLGFWVIFALFFPAVTGFTQGVSMSGELRDPARSLPTGTFAAVALSMVVYVGVAVLFAGALPGSELIADYSAMNRIAVAPWLVAAGLFAATLSSALASFLGAPRILQALATDKLLPFLNPFAVGVGETGNPRRAVLFSFVIALVTIALGDLNVIAPVVSMFFLISYGLLNYATYYEASSRSPSFRPRFRWYHKRLSLLGCLVCAGMMIAIDPTAGAVAIVVLFAIHQYLGRTVGPDRWADGSRSAAFQRVRANLLAMRETPEHDRDWRPVILAFSDDPERRERLARFAAWIEGESGLTTVVRIVSGTGPRVRAERRKAQDALAAELRERGVQAFARVVATQDVEAGFQVLMQASGIGPVRANIALFNWFDREETAEDAPAMRAYGESLRAALRLGCNVVVLAARGPQLQALAEKQEGPRRIDVWWEDGASSRLGLLLAYLMTRTEAWSSARLRVVVAPPTGAAAAAGAAGTRDVSGTDGDTTSVSGDPGEKALAAARARLEEARIPAEPVLAESSGWEGVRAATAGADLALVPMRVRDEGLCDTAGKPLPISLEGLPPLALVNAADDIALDAQPDEGEQADAAQARDALAEIEKLAAERRAAADAARARVDELAERLSAAEARETAEAAEAREETEETEETEAKATEVTVANEAAEDRAALEAEHAAAEAELREAERKAAKTEAKVQQKAEEARALAPGAVKEPAAPTSSGPESAADPEASTP